jgi:hypothetical protein
MALAVKEHVSQYLAWSRLRQLGSPPRVIYGSFIPPLGGVVEGGSKVVDRYEMQIEERVQWAVGPNVIIRHGQANENLAPDQLGAPDVADERLNVGVSADAAG